MLVILGMNPASKKAFMKTLEEMHPVVENMVNEMCEREKERMKALNPKDLGSWSQAVTSADGTWLTRGHHSKNTTFSIRNYLSGALRPHHQGGAVQGNMQVSRRVRRNRACKLPYTGGMPTPLQVAVPSSFFPELRS